MQRGAVTVVGGAGFVGSAVARRATASGRPVVSLDRVRQPPPRLPATVEQRAVDLLVDPVELPPGLVVLAAGGSDPQAGDPWRLVLDNAVTTARLLPALAGRQVVLVVLGRGARPGRRPAAGGRRQRWPAGARRCATRPAGRARPGRWPGCAGSWSPPTRPAAGPTRCPNGRRSCWSASVVAPDRLTVLRAANLFGPGQDRVVAQLTRRALAGLPLAVTDTVRTFLPVDDLARGRARRRAGHARRRAGHPAADRAGRAGAGHARRRRAGDDRPAAGGGRRPAVVDTAEFRPPARGR